MKKLETLRILIFFLLCFRPASGAGEVSFLIFPPENLSKNPALSWMSEVVALSVSDQLRMPGIGAFTREERVSLVEGADLPPNAPLSRASMILVAQHAAADKVVMGFYAGTEESLRITMRVLDLKSMKLGDEIAVNGPLALLPQMENELAWLMISGSGLSKTFSREQFKERTRAIPNAAYACFAQSLSTADQDEKIRLLRKAVEIFRDFPEAQFQLGRFYHQQGDCTETVRHLSLAGNRRSSYLEDQFIIGNCYVKQNDAINAIRSYSAILVYAKSAQALNNSGVANLLKGDYTLAGQNLVEARNLAKADPTIALNLAIFRHLQGNDAAAQILLQEMENTHPNRGMIEYLLSVVLGAQGEKEKSATALARAKEYGADPEKLRGEDPRSWTRLFNSWEGGP